MGKSKALKNAKIPRRVLFIQQPCPQVQRATISLNIREPCVGKRGCVQRASCLHRVRTSNSVHKVAENALGYTCLVSRELDRENAGPAHNASRVNLVR